MDAFLIYSCKLALFLIVLYICIKAFLSRETFHNFNRWVLLGGVGLCLLLPFAKVTISERLAAYIPSLVLDNFFVEEAQSEVLTDANSPLLFIEGINSAENVVEYSDVVAVEQENAIAITAAQALLIIYIIGLIVNLILLGRSAFQMMKLIRANPAQDYKGYKLVITSGNVVPFSWRRYIVISKDDFNTNPEEILTHEIAHIRHRHSLDIIFMECVALLQWFNPAAWLLKRELKDVHEFQADMSVLQSGIDTTKYQLLLVKKAVGASSYTLANSFNHSKIKKRITMMLKEKSSKWARLKLLLLLPLGALAVLAFARPEVNEPASSPVDNESTKNISNGGSEGDIYDETINTYVNGKLVASDVLSRDIIGKESYGKYNLTHTTDTRNDVTTIFPHEFSSKTNPEKADFSKIKYYVSDGNKYTTKDFLLKFKGYRSFFEHSKVSEGNAELAEVYGELADGTKTPTFYMEMIDENIQYQISQSAETKDNPEKEIEIHARSGDKGEFLFSFPTAYNEAKEGEKPMRDNFVKYKVGEKEYTRDEFRGLINGRRFVENKEDLKSGETDVFEFYCITQKGLKTPTWYMVKMKDGKTWKDLEKEDKDRENNKPKNTVKFVPPVIKKDANKKSQPSKKVSEFIPPTVIVDPASEGIDISSNKVGDKVKNSKGEVWEVTSKNPPKIKFISNPSAKKENPVKFVPPVVKKEK